MNKLENFKKKLIYRSFYRGTKEMDILLSNFVKKHVHNFNENELQELDKILDLEDEVIYNFYKKGGIDSPIKDSKILVMLKNFKI
jgi:antitoxin CptB